MLSEWEQYGPFQHSVTPRKAQYVGLQSKFLLPEHLTSHKPPEMNWNRFDGNLQHKADIEWILGTLPHFSAHIFAGKTGTHRCQDGETLLDALRRWGMYMGTRYVGGGLKQFSTSSMFEKVPSYLFQLCWNQALDIIILLFPKGMCSWSLFARVCTDVSELLWVISHVRNSSAHQYVTGCTWQSDITESLEVEGRWWGIYGILKPQKCWELTRDSSRRDDKSQSALRDHGRQWKAVPGTCEASELWKLSFDPVSSSSSYLSLMFVCGEVLNSMVKHDETRTTDHTANDATVTD